MARALEIVVVIVNSVKAFTEDSLRLIMYWVINLNDSQAFGYDDADCGALDLPLTMRGSIAKLAVKFHTVIYCLL